jgi:hypothetical protein
MFYRPTAEETKLGDVLGDDFEYSDTDTFKLKAGNETIEISKPLDKDWKDVNMDELESYVNAAIGGKGMKASFDPLSGSLSIADKDGKKVDISYENDMSQKLAANESCVTMKMVADRESLAWRNVSITALADLESRFPVGSSARMS